MLGASVLVLLRMQELLQMFRMRMLKISVQMLRMADLLLVITATTTAATATTTGPSLTILLLLQVLLPPRKGVRKQRSLTPTLYLPCSSTTAPPPRHDTPPAAITQATRRYREPRGQKRHYGGGRGIFWSTVRLSFRQNRNSSNSVQGRWHHRRGRQPSV